MTTEIATLGLAVDSTCVVAAKKALDDLTASAKPRRRSRHGARKVDGQRRQGCGCTGHGHLPDPP
jgi:hypothetical protein